MNLHTHQLYLFKQHSESFKMCSASIRINTESKSLIMKLGPDITILRYNLYKLPRIVDKLPLPSLPMLQLKSRKQIQTLWTRNCVQMLASKLNKNTWARVYNRYCHLNTIFLYKKHIRVVFWCDFLQGEGNRIRVGLNVEKIPLLDHILELKTLILVVNQLLMCSNTCTVTVSLAALTLEYYYKTITRILKYMYTLIFLEQDASILTKITDKGNHSRHYMLHSQHSLQKMCVIESIGQSVVLTPSHINILQLLVTRTM